MKLPEWLLKDDDNLCLLLDEVKLLLNKYRCDETSHIYICYNCEEYGFSSLRRLVTRSLGKPRASLEANLGIDCDVHDVTKQEEVANLRVEWLEQLEAKLLLELKGK